jgi:hypothetical protein
MTLFKIIKQKQKEETERDYFSFYRSRKEYSQIVNSLF